MQLKKSKKIGLALGGGAAKGYAHIGVIKVLERNNIPVDFIAGTSVGSVVGAMYAFLRDSRKLEDISLSADWRNIFSFKDISLKAGLIKGEKIQKFIADILENATFEKLKIPFSAVATNLQTAESFEISKGDVSLAVKASSSFPLIFNPTKFEDKILWDGGLTNVIPTSTVKKMGADIVIAVNLDNKSYFNENFSEKSNYYSLLKRALQIAQYQIAKNCLKEADIVIEPEVAGLELMGFKKFWDKTVKDIISEGERVAELALPDILSRIK